MEPRFLLHGYQVDDKDLPTFSFEEPSEYLKLALKWDSLGLLRLHEAPLEEGHFSRVFNAFKNEQTDRQIGDRRIPNARERCTCGPSAYLPPGPLLTALQVPRGTHCLLCSMTDRRDFYHQASVSTMRARSNMTPFSFPLEVFSETRALAIWKEEMGSRKQKPDRNVIGDRLGFPEEEKHSKRQTSPEKLFPCFGALFQGDHLGVEFALDAHQGLLRQEGLLAPSRRLENKKPLPFESAWEALIIDDYFCISSQHRHEEREKSTAYDCWRRAKAAYKKCALPGSDEKDVVAEPIFKAAGAEVDSSDAAISLGFVTCGAPLSKRVGLAAVSLRAPRLSAISSGLASRLSGSWVSLLLYRRCLSSLVAKFFVLASEGERKDEPTIMPLSRSTAEELVSLAVMAPLMATDLSAPILNDIFASDSSMARGAVVKTQVKDDIAKILWLGGDKRGHYTMLANPFRAALCHLGEECEDTDEPRTVPEKPLLLQFDFVEIFGGSGGVSRSMASMGFVVAPVLDLSNSSAYDISQNDLMRWVFHMIESGAFKSLLLEPPCATFSPAAYPAVRSYAVPKGWWRKHPKVLQGNLTAFRSLIIFKFARKHKRPSGLEQSRRSKMAWLPEWKSELTKGTEEAVVASCQFGSIHQKEFRFLLNGIPASWLDRRCSRDHTHVKIQGKFTKPSAVYTPELSDHLARAFARAIAEKIPEEFGEGCGLESLVVNDVLQASRWSLVRAWFWRTKSHINVLETGSVCDPEVMADCLVQYGRQLYSSGKTYQRYAETINALAAHRPIVKRQLTKAWDLAFAWVQDEPCRHHPAMPVAVLLSMLSVALMWGWQKEAALWALAWAGILRVGELIMATRSDLILPADGVPGTSYILLRIREPKTRGRGPRHQAARVDQADLVQLIQMTFQKETADAKLWPLSAATLRKRFNAVQVELGLPLKPSNGSRPYELASLRAGGATWLLQRTELPELVRRRGRWLAFRTMEVYLQEIVVTTSMSHVTKEAKYKIQLMAEAFPSVLEQIVYFCKVQVPPRAWYFLFTAREAGSGRD